MAKRIPVTVESFPGKQTLWQECLLGACEVLGIHTEFRVNANNSTLEWSADARDVASAGGMGQVLAIAHENLARAKAGL